MSVHAIRKLSFWVVSLGMLAMLAGCAATRADVAVEPGVSLQKFTQVEVAEGANETGSSAYDETAQTFASDLRSALQSEGVTLSDAGAPGSTLVVKPALVHYEPGSALARWILPGLGRTQATVSAALIDKGSGDSVGDVGASDQVTGGGLLSVGQERFILSRLAGDVAGQIATRLRSD
jgi:Domain of unknown function (DUF4410)